MSKQKPRPRALVYFRHNPWPPRTGAHQRCLAFIRALQACGYDVVLFGSDLLTDTRWLPEQIAQLEAAYSIKVEVHRGTPADFRQCSKIYWDDAPPQKWGHFATPSLRRAFVEATRRYDPEIVCVNYTCYGDMIQHPEFAGRTTIMETLDLYSLNAKIQKIFLSCMPPPPIAPAATPSFLLRDDFIDAFPLAPYPEEFQMCDLYDLTIMVSPAETEILRQHTRKTKVHMLPITAEPVPLRNTYRGGTLFMAAINMLNVQGYLYFAQRVMPLLNGCRGNFSLDVVGSCCRHVQAMDGIRLLGYVDSVEDHYRNASFAICPLLSATGQQIKVVEAMAHGLPVVIHKNTAASSPVIHEENGLIANSAEEFADYCQRLHHNRKLCRTMGEAARETIRRNWSQQVMNEQLAAALRSVKTVPSKADSRSLAAQPRLAKPKATAQATSSTTLWIRPKGSLSRLETTLCSIHAQTLWPRSIVIIGRPSPKIQDLLKKTGLSRTIAIQYTTKGPPLSSPDADGSAMFLCAGDVLAPEALRLASEALHAHPDVDGLQGRPTRCDRKGEISWAMESIPVSDTSPDYWHRRAGMIWRTRRFDEIFSQVRNPWTPQGFLRALHQSLSQGKQPAVFEAILGAASDRKESYTIPAAIKSPTPISKVICTQESLKQLQGNLHRLQHREIAKHMDALNKKWIDHSKEIQSYVENIWPQTIALHKTLFRHRWEQWAHFNGRTRRVALFGAGKHTQWLLWMLNGTPGPFIPVILDDKAQPGDLLNSIPVIRPEAFDPQTVDSIIPSSDSFEKEIIERCKQLYGRDVQILRLYDQLPKGPYPKEEL